MFDSKQVGGVGKKRKNEENLQKLEEEVKDKKAWEILYQKLINFQISRS